MRTVNYTITCDVDKTTTAMVTVASPVPLEEVPLPSDWLNLKGQLFGAQDKFNDNDVDVCPACLAQLSGLPAQWQAIIPAVPT
jgi:hypothetical protein